MMKVTAAVSLLGTYRYSEELPWSGWH